MRLYCINVYLQEQNLLKLALKEPFVRFEYCPIKLLESYITQQMVVFNLCLSHNFIRRKIKLKRSKRI
jgi:hypothetical protein